MAIKIPSKNIYDLNAKKVKNNIIGKIVYNKTNYVAKSENKQVPSYSFTTPTSGTVSDAIGSDSERDSTNTTYRALACVGYIDVSYYKYTIYVPYNQNSQYYYPTIFPDDIKINCQYKEYKRDNHSTSVYVQYKYAYNTNRNMMVDQIVKKSYWDDSNNVSGVNLEETGNFVDRIPNLSVSASYGTASAYIEGEFKPTRNYNITISDNQIIISNVIIPKSVDTIMLKGQPAYADMIIDPTWGAIEQYSVPDNTNEPRQLESYRYVLEEDTISFDIQPLTHYFENEPIKVELVGSVSGSDIDVQENEFIQTDIDDIFEDVLDGYKNGKETATIRCSISDYYDDSDPAVKVISADKSTGRMCFDIYDEVIPYKMDYSGQDVPMSRYQNGDPKVFKVLATKIYYDGAVWQELSLQEVSQSE